MIAVYNLGRFIIQKGEGIYNLFDFINAVMGSESYNATKASLIDSHHDITHNDITGVEGDAAELAFNKGFGDPAMAQKYHAGPMDRMMLNTRRLSGTWCMLARVELIN